MDVNWYPAFAHAREMRLYEQAKAKAWDPVKDVHWETPIRFEQGAHPDDFRLHRLNLIAQFYVGEQAGLTLASQLVGLVPEPEAKFCLSAQALDESKHMQVFGLYAERLGGRLKANPLLEELLDDIAQSQTYEEKIVGAQILFEGMILELIRGVRRGTPDPLLHEILSYVLVDESRHTGFGMLYLRRKLEGASSALRHQIEDSIGRWVQLYQDTMCKRVMNLPKLPSTAQCSIDFPQIVTNGYHVVGRLLQALDLRLKAPAPL